MCLIPSNIIANGVLFNETPSNSKDMKQETQLVKNQLHCGYEVSLHYNLNLNCNIGHIFINICKQTLFNVLEILINAVLILTSF